MKTNPNNETLTQQEEELLNGVRLFGNDEQKKRFKNLMSILVKSDSAKDLLSEMKFVPVSYGFVSGLGNTMAALDTTTGRMMFNDTCTDEELVVCMAHEIRHVSQMRRKASTSWKFDDVKTQVMGESSKEADADAYSALVAWELKNKGYKKIWQDFKKDRKTVADAFEKELSKLGNYEENKPSLLKAGFKGWFDDKKLMHSYGETLSEELLQKVERWGGKMGFMSLKDSKDFIEACCHFKGACYYDENPDNLIKGKIISISKSASNNFKEVMKIRKERFGLEPDKSLESINVKDENKKLNVKAISLRQKTK